MSPAFDLAAAQDFATALLIGALIGIEREKRRIAEKDVDTGGLRTFIVVAEIGAVAGWLSRSLGSPWPLAAALTAVAGLLVASYILAVRAKPDATGLTTEVAALAVCLLGALTTLGHRELAIGLGVVTAAALAYKHTLHGLVDKLGWEDVYAGLRLLIATFIVLPLLPNEFLDPWGALNPYALWILVLLISGLSLIGYVATRWLGQDKGALLTGITGGLVSSTAVTLTFARLSRDVHSPAGAYALAGGILLAWIIMLVRVFVEVMVVNRDLWAAVLPPFLAMGAAAALALVWLFLRGGAATPDGSGSPEVPLKNPFSLTAAIQFAAFFALTLLLVKLAQIYLPGGGQYALAILAGFADVDAIALSMAEMAKSGNTEVAVRAIVLATLANTLTKAGMVLVLGGRAVKWPIAVATVLVMVTGAVWVV